MMSVYLSLSFNVTILTVLYILLDILFKYHKYVLPLIINDPSLNFLTF